MLGKYAIISPVRDEEQYIERTLQSVIDQTYRPVEWVIVDDGSTDRTAAIVRHAAAEHPWIKLVLRRDRGQRQPGQGVVEAVNYGRERLSCGRVDFICKMDGDLEFGPYYFETLLMDFIRIPRLGMASGNTYIYSNENELVQENAASGFVVGPIKLYRMKCFEAIGGLEPHLGWDTIDNYKARMHGWETRNYPDLRVIHLRPMGTAKGIVWGKMRTGRGDYYTGTHPLFEIVRSLYRMGDYPFVLNGLSIALGYLKAMLRREQRIADPEFIRFIRKDQLERLKRMVMPWRRAVA